MQWRRYRMTERSLALYLNISWRLLTLIIILIIIIIIQPPYIFDEFVLFDAICVIVSHVILCKCGWLCPGGKQLRNRGVQMPRSIRKLCTQDVLASATWLPCSRQSPAWSLRHGAAGHVQSARDVTRPADPRRRGGLRQGQASTAAKEAEARRRAADPQGTAGLRRRVGRLLCRYTRPSVYPAVWTTEPRGRSPGRPARSGRLRRAVLRAGLQRVSTHDDVQMSVSLRLVLPRWLRRLSTHRERAGVQVTQPTDVTVAGQWFSTASQKTSSQLQFDCTTYWHARSRAAIVDLRCRF